MAVFQISKIQVRRGSKDSLPQLSSGELGWAIDERQLFIGNGSVSDGAPAVGNTKVLTEHDLSTSLIQTLQYTYDSDATDGSLQGKLAENVSSKDFGTKGNGITDDTTSFQTAINTLFNNTTNPATGSGGDNVKARVTLSIPPGIYKISGSIIVPSYATIIGAGIDKTIFNYVPDPSSTTPGTAFITTADEVTHDIVISDLTITTTSNLASTLLNLHSTNSIFTNLKLFGSRTSTNLSVESKGIKILEDSENLIFENINISNVCFAVDARQRVTNLKFNNGYFDSIGYGLVLGNITTGFANENQITNIKFINVTANAILITKGTKNYVNNCIMTHVGNDQDDVQARYPQVYFANFGNVCTNLKSNRGSTTSNTTRYVPEVAGFGEYSRSTFTTELVDNVAWHDICRLPFNISSLGTGTIPVSYKITYFYKCDSYVRSGVISFAADTTHLVNSEISISDDFTVSGNDDNALLLDFLASINYQSITISARNMAATSTLRQLTYSYVASF